MNKELVEVINEAISQLVDMIQDDEEVSPDFLKEIHVIQDSLNDGYLVVYASLGVHHGTWTYPIAFYINKETLAMEADAY